MSDNTVLGIDIGSCAIKTVVLEADGTISHTRYTRIKKKVEDVFLEALDHYRTMHIPFNKIAFTGRGSSSIIGVLDVPLINEIYAQAAGALYLQPDIKSIIDMGGNDAAYISLEEGSTYKNIQIRDFATNSRCSAGTGSFLDQQSARLGINIENDFSKQAMSAETIPRIAGRCSVFAKSDMIHLQQIATPDGDIVAGLCMALAESFRSDILKGVTPVLPVSFQGGVSLNEAMAHFLRKAFKINEDDLIVPENSQFTGAIGAAVRGREDKKFYTYDSCELIAGKFKSHKVSSQKKGLELLSDPQDSYILPTSIQFSSSSPVKDGYIGIDIGSISTNLVLMDIEGRIVSKRYLMTAGKPIEAVKEGLRQIYREIGDSYSIKGCGTTGSGRYLIGDIFGADLIKNEITAQARGAVFVCPDVDTIFEIGGQDSKYISIENGMVVDFTMNKACAAGTGSFLEEQADLLGISIKDEFAKKAFQSSSPTSLGQRCTVFMESDVVKKLAEGESIENLCAGLSYSIVENYLNRVVERRKIGDNILFQGGTAFNRAVTAAFCEVTGKKVKVPPHNEVTGAIGMAVIIKEAYEKEEFPTNFKGFSQAEMKYSIKTFNCHDCANNCEVRAVSLEGKEPLYYGHRCEKYEKKKKNTNARDYNFLEIRNKLIKSYVNKNAKDVSKGTVGIPMGLGFYETLPFWSAFFNELGYEVVLSSSTSRSIINRGIAKVTAETCFPVKVFHGHVDELLKKKVDHVFIPAVINMPLEGSNSEHNFNCTLVQSSPYMIKSAFRDMDLPLLAPNIHFQYGLKSVAKELDDLRKKLKIKKSLIYEALKKASFVQEDFEKKIKSEGREFIEKHKDTGIVVIVSRPYNGTDPGLNLGIPKKLADMGMPSISLDALPAGKESLKGVDGMYWRYGKRILDTLLSIKGDKRFLPVFITNFNCGPDSFILHQAVEIMQDEPVLFLEVDEHSADAGALTRIEAFLDSVKNRIPKKTDNISEAKSLTTLKGKRVYVPNMSDISISIAAAFRKEGIEAQVLPEPDERNIAIGRSLTSGKECYPFAITTGDLFLIAERDDFEPGRAAFFMPTTNGPCRFGQYAKLQENLLKKRGIEGIEIFSPSSGDGYDALRGLSSSFYFNIWKGMVCTDVLYKALLATRPYETVKGSTDKIYKDCLKKLEKILESGDSSLLNFMKECRKLFDEVEVKKKQKVLIGMVGEIYVRTNHFANRDIIRRLEELGAEVVLAPFGEWSFYANYLSKNNNIQQGKYLGAVTDYIKNNIQEYIEHRYHSAFKNFGLFHEPNIKDIIGKASEFLDESIRGEALLSLGKSIDFIQRGFSGIVNVMPFSCMPGLIVSAMVPAIRQKYENVPWLNVSFEDSESNIDMMQLEAFLEQARTYSTKKTEDKKRTYASTGK